jgi:hypothetical protein
MRPISKHTDEVVTPSPVKNIAHSETYDLGRELSFTDVDQTFKNHDDQNFTPKAETKTTRFLALFRAWQTPSSIIGFYVIGTNPSRHKHLSLTAPHASMPHRNRTLQHLQLSARPHSHPLRPTSPPLANNQHTPKLSDYAIAPTRHRLPRPAGRQRRRMLRTMPVADTAAPDHGSPTY